MTRSRIAPLALSVCAFLPSPAAAQVCDHPGTCSSTCGGGDASYDANATTNQGSATIPAGCKKLQVKAWGCGGGRGGSPSGGGGGFAQGNFQIPGTSDFTLALDYAFSDAGSGNSGGGVSRVTNLADGAFVLVAGGGGGGGTSGSHLVGGRGGAGGQNGQDGQSVTGDCDGTAGGGGGATPTGPGAGGTGHFPGENGQFPNPATGVGRGGAGAPVGQQPQMGGSGAAGRNGGGGGGFVGDHWSGDPIGYCRYGVGAGGGGGSSWVNLSEFAPLPATASYASGSWDAPGNSSDPDRYMPAPASRWAGNGATPSAAATAGRIVVRWRGPYGFFDVAPPSGYRPWIEKLACNGITSGCGGDNFCPGQSMTREQMAPWLLIAKEGPGYTPPACIEPGPFSDVPCTSPYARWIQELVARHVTGGCAPGLYCPTQPVTREQMAVFLLVTKEGSGYVPPACTTPSFLDVPCSSVYARWIEELKRRGITNGCGDGYYCPTQPVTREQMAVYLGTTFTLPDCPQ